MRSTVAQAVPTAGLLGKKIAPALTRASLGVSAATSACSAICHLTPATPPSASVNLFFMLSD